MKKFKFLLLLFVLCLQIKCISQDKNDYDTIYIMDYFYKGPPGIDYRGSTTVFIPNRDSVVLQTKPVQIMPVDFEQYAMLKLIIPKDSSVALKILFNAKKRKMNFERTEKIILKRTSKAPTIYYGRLLIENCRKGNTYNCPLRIRNSDNLSNAFIKNILNRNIEKGVTHIYNAVTGELIENPVFFN